MSKTSSQLISDIDVKPAPYEPKIVKKKAKSIINIIDPHFRKRFKRIILALFYRIKSSI